MNADDRAAQIAAMRKHVQPEVLEFLDYCREKLFVESLLAARKIGMTPSEARECAGRIVVAAVKTMGAGVRKLKNRERLGLSVN